MSIYCKYALDETKNVVLSYVGDCVYLYASEALVKCLVDTLGKRFHGNFLVYAHFFMSIRIYQIKDHSISVDQAIYATSIVVTYLDTATFNTSTKFYNTTLPSDMIFFKAYTSTSDDPVNKMTSEFNICYISSIISLIYLLSTRVYLSFALHKLTEFHEILVK